MRIKSAFDSIQAEDALKSGTMMFLQDEMRKREIQQHRIGMRKHMVAFAVFAIALMTGLFSYDLYFSPCAYLDMEVNPAFGFSINRFDRVIDAYAYNSDGEAVISGLELTHKSRDEALRMLMDAMTRGGYVQDGGLVSVTVQMDDTGREGKLLADVKNGITDHMTGHHISGQVDVFPVSGDIRSIANDFHVSPAKYQAIRSLQEIDPTVGVESYRDYSIMEIKQMTHEHDRMRHHDEIWENGQENIEPAAEPDVGYSGNGCGDNDNHDNGSGDSGNEHSGGGHQ